MSFAIALAALGFLMLVAYRGYSVILFAPIAALGAVLLTDPMAVLPVYTGLFMDKMVGFVKLYFPVFMLGAVFGKLIELSGFSRAIVSAVIGMLGRERAIISIVLVCNLLTYGGVSLFVVVFAVYPFAAEAFRQSEIPKRLIPGTSRSAPLATRWMRCRVRRRSRTLSRAPSSAPIAGRRRSSAWWVRSSSSPPASPTCPGGCARPRRAARAMAPAMPRSRRRRPTSAWPIRRSPSPRWSLVPSVLNKVLPAAVPLW